MEEIKKSITAEKDLKDERKRLSFFSLILSFVLLCFKFYAYHETGSQSIFSDALESIVNVAAGIITLIVVIIAAKPADDDHPYGHGKLESMAATFEGGAMTFAGALIVIQSVQIYFHGVTITDLNLGLAITLFAGAVNGLFGAFLHRRGKKLHSEALRSSGAHLLGDALTSVGVLFSLIVVKWTGKVWIDPVIAAIFGLMLCWTGIKILIRTSNVLLDAHDKETIKVLAKLFEKHYMPGLIAIHYTRVIRSGNFHHIDCHVVLPEFWTVAHAHLFSDQFEAMVIEDYPVEAALHMHLDPCRKVYCENCEINNCSIRQKDFVKRIALDNLEEMTAPSESR